MPLGEEWYTCPHGPHISQSQFEDLSRELNCPGDAANPNAVGLRTKFRVADVASAISAPGQGIRSHWIAGMRDTLAQKSQSNIFSAVDWFGSDLPVPLELDSQKEADRTSVKGGFTGVDGEAMQAQPPSLDRFDLDTWDWKSVDDSVSIGYESDTEGVGQEEFGLRPTESDFSEGYAQQDRRA